MRRAGCFICAVLAVLSLDARAGDERCAARRHELTWLAGPIEDETALNRWCRGVGPPLVVSVPASPPAVPPPLEDIVVVSWNTHLAEGRLTELITRLRAGAFTNGRPVAHFMLLLQELFRRGPEVPAFADDMRSAFAITSRDPSAPDVRDYARTLGLSIVYVPSMRNGAALFEDRGNAIISSEPLVDAIAFELPFERQRRVAVGAAIRVGTAAGPKRLHVLNAHLEPLSAPSSLWIFRNPRRRQVAALLNLLESRRFDNDGEVIGTVLGGDFNTIQGGMNEDAYVQARAWSTSLESEDRRSTHQMGRIDYLFFRLDRGWAASSTRLDEKFGSDHHPVLGRIRRTP